MPKAKSENLPLCIACGLPWNFFSVADDLCQCENAVLEGSLLKPLLDVLGEMQSRLSSGLFDASDYRRLVVLIHSIDDAFELGLQAAKDRDVLNEMAWLTFHESLVEFLYLLEVAMSCDLSAVHRCLRFWKDNNCNNQVDKAEWLSLETEAEIALKRLKLRVLQPALCGLACGRDPIHDEEVTPQRRLTPPVHLLAMPGGPPRETAECGNGTRGIEGYSFPTDVESAIAYDPIHDEKLREAFATGKKLPALREQLNLQYQPMLSTKPGIQHLKKLCDESRTLGEVADKLGVSTKTVSTALRKNGMESKFEVGNPNLRQRSAN